jgi:hypothetical protein
MKKYAFQVLAIICLTGCKKEKEKSLTELVDETVWTGECKYSARDFAEPFSIEFDGNGGYKWFEADGQGVGTYTLDDANRTITLQKTSGTGSPFAFKVAGNSIGETNLNPLGYFNISYGSLSSAFTQSIDNTTWSGTIEFYAANKLYELKFKPFSKMTYTWEPDATSGEFSYTRNKACIAYVYGSSAFGIFKGDSIIGVHSDGVNYRKYRIKRK